MSFPLLFFAAGCSLLSSGELRDASGRQLSAIASLDFQAPLNPTKYSYIIIPIKLRFFPAISQSVDDCTATVQIVGTTSAPNQIDIPLGTVCVQCVVNGAVDTATTTFLIGNSPIQGVVDNGVMVVDDTSMTFQASPALTLRCVSGSGGVRQASVYLDGMSPMFV